MIFGHVDICFEKTIRFKDRTNDRECEKELSLARQQGWDNSICTRYSLRNSTDFAPCSGVEGTG